MEKYLIAEFETYAREPILRKMPDGSLICMFLTGGPSEPYNENFVAVSRSFDDGKTWEEPQKLFDHESRGVWCTEICTEKEIPTAFVHTYNAKSHYRELITFVSQTFDNGKTWTTPISIPGTVRGCSMRQAITLSNGDILVPLYCMEGEAKFDWTNEWVSETSEWYFRCGVGICPKGDTNFYRYGNIQLPATNLWEPNAIEVENGHVIMYLRSNCGFLRYSESFDYGRTWSEVKDLPIPHADTKITALKIKDNIILINNFATREEGRIRLAIAKSKDGINFEHICYLEEENTNIFYPHAFADDETQTLYVAYENAKLHWLKKYSYSELGL